MQLWRRLCRNHRRRPSQFCHRHYLSGTTFFTLGLGDVVLALTSLAPSSSAKAGFGFGFPPRHSAIFRSFTVLSPNVEVDISLLDSAQARHPLQANSCAATATKVARMPCTIY